MRLALKVMVIAVAAALAVALVGALAPLMVIASFALFVLALGYPETIDHLLGSRPLRWLPESVRGAPSRFALVGALTLLPLSAVAGVAVYGALYQAGAIALPRVALVPEATVGALAPTPTRTPKPTPTPRPTKTPKPTPTRAPNQAGPRPTPTPSPIPQIQIPPPTLPGTSCRTTYPLANVPRPNRLEVQVPCQTVTGVVIAVVTQGDGDVLVRLLPDPPYTHLLNEQNRTQQKGNLPVTIVPADQPGCTPGKPPRPPEGSSDWGLCTGAAIRPPAPGSHVSVTGPYVLDKAHGWMAIYPAWAIVPTP